MSIRVKVAPPDAGSSGSDFGQPFGWYPQVGAAIDWHKWGWEPVPLSGETAPTLVSPGVASGGVAVNPRQGLRRVRYDCNFAITPDVTVGFAGPDAFTPYHDAGRYGGGEITFLFGFGTNNASFNSRRLAVGLAGLNISAPTALTALTNMILVGRDPADAELFLIVRGTTAVSKLALGAIDPARLYELTISNGAQDDWEVLLVEWTATDRTEREWNFSAAAGPQLTANFRAVAQMNPLNNPGSAVLEVSQVSGVRYFGDQPST